MRLKIGWIILAMFACVSVGMAADPQSGSDGLGDSYYPQLGNGGYDVQHYTIELAVDVEKNTLSGSTTIEAKATQDLSAFNLDFSGLDVSAVTVNDVAADFSRNDAEMTITPAAALAEGASFRTVVEYSGTPQPVDDPGVPFIAIGWESFQPGIFVLSEPSGAMSWFPCNNHPLDKATYTFRISVPKAYVVAANGLLKDTIEEGAHTTYLWESSNPIASYLAALNISKFKVVNETGPNDLPIRNYFPADAPNSLLKTVTPTADIIAYFSDLIAPYPFESYGVAVMDVPNAGVGLENQTLSVISTDLMTDELTLAHELAHQWFGDSVSVKSWQDIWLNEGFAQYLQALWLEHTQGETAFHQYMDGYYSALTNNSWGPPGDPGIRQIFGGSVYLRGAWTLHALRLKVGDDVFFNILRTYYDRYKYSNASTGDFIAVAEEISGQKLDDFFNAWLYSDTLPKEPSQG